MVILLADKPAVTIALSEPLRDRITTEIPAIDYDYFTKLTHTLYLHKTNRVLTVESIFFVFTNVKIVKLLD